MLMNQIGKCQCITSDNALKSITFGANIPSRYEEALRAIIQRRECEVEIMRAVLDPETFDLRVIRAQPCRRWMIP